MRRADGRGRAERQPARPRDRAGSASALPPTATLVRQSPPGRDAGSPRAPDPRGRTPAGHGPGAGRTSARKAPAPIRSRRPEHPPGQLRVGHADQPPALRPEQRLDHHVAAQRLEGVQRRVGRLADPGRRAPAGPRPRAGARARYLSTAASTAPGGLITGHARRAPAGAGRPCGRRPAPATPAASSGRARRRRRRERDPARLDRGRPSARPGRRSRERDGVEARSPIRRPPGEVLDVPAEPGDQGDESADAASVDRRTTGARTPRLEPAEGVDAAGLEVLEDDLGGAEQVGVDGVEVVVVAGEDRGERLAVVARAATTGPSGRSLRGSSSSPVTYRTTRAP